MNRRFLLALLAGWFGSAFAAAPLIPGEDVFATNAPVLRILIEIPRAGIASLQREHRKDVMATVREGDHVYNNVAVHLKGAAGSFRDINSGNPALTLNFAKSNSTQRFHGLRKIHLNNSVQDPSFSTENIVGQMFRDAGVPTTRASNARVALNGRDLGFYVLKEGWTKDFLGMHFKDTKGNLYDGGFLQDIDNRLEKDSGDERKDQPDLDALVAVCRSNPATRWQALDKVLDRDRFLTYMAIESITWDWDGYMANRNNYRVYHDPTTDKMVFLPHGLDQMFEQTGTSVYQPQLGGLVARAIWETPEGRSFYRERMKEVFAKYFKLETITARLDNLAKRNHEAISEFGRGAQRNHDASVEDLRRRIVARWENIKSQIENEPVPMRFDQGPVLIKGWHPADFGNGQLNRAEIAGKPSLRISANGQSTGSWRARVQLDGGRYRFEAMARSSRLAGYRNEKGEGAGIRISMQNRGNRIVGDTDWTKMTFDFDVPPGSNDITLICESMASRGDAWFAADSLKLTKLR